MSNRKRSASGSVNLHNDEQQTVKSRRLSNNQISPVYKQILTGTDMQIQMINKAAESVLKAYETNSKKQVHRIPLSNNKVIIYNSTWNKKGDKLRQTYGDKIEIVDITDGQFEGFSTRYLWGGIEVPFSNSTYYSMSLDRIWEGLKVYNNNDPDLLILNSRKAPSLQSHEVVTGWWRGPYGKKEPLLNVQEAHWYLTMLPYKKHIESEICSEMLEAVQEKYDKASRVIIIDKRVHSDLNSPLLLSGAFLLKLYLDGKYPTGPTNHV